MLNLNTGIDLDEVMSSQLVHQELRCPGVAVSNALGELHGVVQDSLPNLLGQIHSRRNLDDLLVSPLDRAVTLKEVNNVPLSIREDLHLDVPRTIQEPLDEYRSVAKSQVGLARGTRERVPELALLSNHTHAASTASHRRLDDNGEPILLDECRALFVRTNRTRGARDDRDADRDGDLSRIGLVSERINDFGGRPHECETGLLDFAGEHCVLGEEAVAGVDHVDAMFEGNGDDVVLCEIGSDRRKSEKDAIGREPGQGSGPEGDRVQIQATYTAICDKDFRQRTMVTRGFASERLDRVDRRPRRAGCPRGELTSEARRVKRRRHRARR